MRAGSFFPYDVPYPGALREPVPPYRRGVIRGADLRRRPLLRSISSSAPDHRSARSGECPALKSRPVYTPAAPPAREAAVEPPCPLRKASPPGGAVVLLDGGHLWEGGSEIGDGLAHEPPWLDSAPRKGRWGGGRPDRRAFARPGTSRALSGTCGRRGRGLSAESFAKAMMPQVPAPVGGRRRDEAEEGRKSSP